MNRELQDSLDHFGIELTHDSGREISRPKDVFYSHTGIIIGRDKTTKIPIVFHNHPVTGVALVAYQTFAANNNCSYTGAYSDDWEKVLLRSFRQIWINKPYDAINYNCQHATSFSRTGAQSSTGLQATIFVGVLALVFGGAFTGKQ